MNRRLKLGLAPVVLAGVLSAVAPALAGPVESLMARSRAAEAAGRFADATLLMQSAVVADPARVESYVALADLYARHSEPNFALKYYEEALYLDPTMAAALLGAGRADLVLGDLEAAKQKLTRLEGSCGHDCPEAVSLRAAIEAGKNAKPDATSASLDKH